MTYSAATVAAAAGMTPAILNNVIARHRPRLSSASAGQGRAWPFVRRDIERLALAHALTAITRNAEWSTRAIDSIADDEEIWDARHPYKVSDCWLLFSDQRDIESGVPKLMIFGASERPGELMWSEAGHVLNATRVLANVERRLTAIEQEVAAETII